MPTVAQHIAFCRSARPSALPPRQLPGQAMAVRTFLALLTGALNGCPSAKPARDAVSDAAELTLADAEPSPADFHWPMVDPPTDTVVDAKASDVESVSFPGCDIIGGMYLPDGLLAPCTMAMACAVLAPGSMRPGGGRDLEDGSFCGTAGQVAVGSKVELRGFAESQCGMALVSYSWRAEVAPVGATVKFKPSSSSQNPSFIAASRGHYILRLRAFNALGAYNCVPALVDIVAN